MLGPSIASAIEGNANTALALTLEQALDRVSGIDA
jgi:hypothetical protein